MPVFLLSFLFSVSVLACEFSPETKGVYSLSGTVTLLLKDLGLLNKPQVKAVSVFHPVSKNDFKGEFLPGGVFLSHQSIQKLAGSIVYFDESRELARIFSRYPEIQAIEVKTRSMTPVEAVVSVEKLLLPIVKSCPQNQKEKMARKLFQLKSLIKSKPHILFFLGHIQNGKYPELLMVQDGVVKWMVDEKLISTYPSELAYVNWSAKLMNSLPKNAYKVGIKDSGSEMKTELKKSDHVLNLTYPGSLIPGDGQVDAMIYLFKDTTF